MELLRERCANVVPFDMQNALTLAPECVFAGSDKVLKEKGLTTTCYTLGRRNMRISVPGITLRDVWARSCEEAVGKEIWEKGEKLPILRVGDLGVLTAHLKPCYTEGPEFKARVSIDLDCSPDGASKPFPTTEQIFEVTAAFLQKSTEGDYEYAKEACIIFLGSSAAKNRTCHVIFPNLCFARVKSNILGKAHPHSATFNKPLAPLGFESDFSICTSGFRWEFTDKYNAKHKTWRGATSELAAFYNMEYYDVIPWRELSPLIDPHVLPIDEAYDREVIWKVVGSNKKKASKALAPKTVHVMASVPDEDAVEKRIAAAFPALVGVSYKRIQMPDGVLKLQPQSTYCPFKMIETDEPAHAHSSPKLYMFCKPNGQVQVHCGVCQGASATVAAPKIALANLIGRFNSRYARMQEYALQLPIQNSDGSFTDFRKLSYNSFKAATKNNNAPVITDAGKLTEGDYWWGHSNATSYPKGLIFDPSCSHDPGYYNTWQGWCPKVMRVAESMEHLTDDELDKEWELTRQLILSNICNNDNELFEQVIGFFVDMVLHPERKPKWAISVHGPQGSGKGLTVQFFLTLAGSHGVQNDGGMLSESFNGYAMTSILLFCDEGVNKINSTVSAKIKRMVTESSQVVSIKYQPQYSVETVMRIVVASNNNPAFLEDGDRRWLVCRSDFRMANFDKLTGKIAREAESLRGPAAFYLLAHRRGDVANFDFARTIRTPERWNVLYQQLEPFELFVYHRLCLDDEDFLAVHSLPEDQYPGFESFAELGLNTNAWTNVLPKAFMWLSFVDYNGGVPPKGCSDKSLWKYLKALFPDTADPFSFTQSRAHALKRTFKLPTRARFQDRFVKSKGLNAQIFTDWKK